MFFGDVSITSLLTVEVVHVYSPVGRFRHFSKSGTGNDDELGTGNLNAGNAGHQICLKFVPVIAVPVITGGRPALPVTGNTSGNWQPPSPAQRSKNPKMFSSPKPSLCFRREIQKVCFRQQRFFTGEKKRRRTNRHLCP